MCCSRSDPRLPTRMTGMNESHVRSSQRVRLMIVQRSTLSFIGHWFHGVRRRKRESIASSEATLARLAVSPRTVIDLTPDESEQLEQIVSAREPVATP
jgi:hypothetical protein